MNVVFRSVQIPWAGLVVAACLWAVFLGAPSVNAGVCDMSPTECLGFNLSPLTAGCCANLVNQIEVNEENCNVASTKLAACKGAMPVGGSLFGMGPCGTLDTFVGKCMNVVKDTIKYATCNTGPRGPGCCLQDLTEVKPEKIIDNDHTCTTVYEQCEDKSVVHYSCCVCIGPGSQPVAVSSEMDSYFSCKSKCESGGMQIYSALGVGRYSDENRMSITNSLNPPVKDDTMKMCFKPEVCQGKGYGGIFKGGYGCPKGMGRCIAPEPNIPLSSPIAGQMSVQGLRGYIGLVFKYMLMIAVIVAAIMFVYGGFRYIVGSSFGSIKEAQKIMIDAGAGLVLLLTSITLLRTVNPDVLNMTRLDVWMINKESQMLTSWCSELKPVNGKSLSFADAGTRPSYKPINEAKYDTEGKSTVCDHEYYIEGSSADLRCFGRACPEGRACINCKGLEDRIPECKGKGGYTCVEGQWAGVISWDKDRKPQIIQPLVVCEGYDKALSPTALEKVIKPVLQPGTLFDTEVKANTDTSLTDTMKDAVKSTGVTPYRMKFPSGFNLDQVCGGKAKGLLLMVRYVDRPDTSGVSCVGCPKRFGDSGGFAFVSKAQCNAGRLYVDVQRTNLNAALWCSVQNGDANAHGIPDDTSAYWTQADIDDSYKGKALGCDVTLSDSTVPNAPTGATSGDPNSCN